MEISFVHSMFGKTPLTLLIAGMRQSALCDNNSSMLGGRKSGVGRNLIRKIS
jgi:hypothetical protein